MPQISDAQHELVFRFAYFGPPGSGRGANLRRLHSSFPEDVRSRLKAIEIRGDRSLSFRLSLPLHAGSGEDWTLTLALVALTGQIRASATRRKAFSGIDGVVFCAPALPNMQAQNRESFREGRSILQALYDAPPPGVVQFSHLDASGALAHEEIENDWKDVAWPLFTAQPKTGEGVRETLGAILRLAADRSRQQLEQRNISLDDVTGALVTAMRSSESSQ